MAKEGSPGVVQLPETVREVSFEELCAICHITPDFVIELVAYGTIEPHGNSAANWSFDSKQLHVIRTAIRLQQDLEVNHAGIALAIDLLRQMEELQMELATFRKYFKM